YKLNPQHHVSYYIIGNPDLKPEISHGYSLDLENSWANALLGRVSFFRNDIENMIASKSAGKYSTGEDIMQSYNVDEAFSQGYEIELQYSPLTNLNTSIGYTYSQVEDKTIEKQIRNMPKHTGKFLIQYNNEQYGMGFHYDMQYIGKMYTDAKLSKESDECIIANAKLSKDITKSIGMFLAVDNIFDEVPSTENSRYFNMARLWSLGLNFKI
ncbi:MAG: TonB-dependent receptor, partial [Desulfobulbaceae bacterium]|nr:TonB-dependent receptor [Desulfobulbaceae bacterium]